MLPTLKKGTRIWIIDLPLRQARNRDNPHDYTDFPSEEALRTWAARMTPPVSSFTDNHWRLLLALPGEWKPAQVPPAPGAARQDDAAPEGFAPVKVATTLPPDDVAARELADDLEAHGLVRIAGRDRHSITLTPKGRRAQKSLLRHQQATGAMSGFQVSARQGRHGKAH